jgi:DNA-binding response OmpR family regulator
MKILIVEDEQKVAAFIEQGLTERGYKVDKALEGERGKKLAIENEYDLIILDVMLPKKNGIEITEEIRKFNKRVPILLLTALGETEDKVRGFEAGADDYLVKPFHFKEFLARVKALTRRNAPEEGKEKVLKFADLEFNLETKVAKRAGNTLKLTAREFALLEFIMRNPERVLNRPEISEYVWGINFDTGTNVVDVYMNYLRNKVDKGYDKKLIHTIVGMGYILKEE